ncbi:hypothetical protein FJTKL_10796 [Diaporthe vaccinii]|uniref:Mutanase n=1 Tax=Diaporthe vaccinii TaxID=105482 RepID=A0ABR4FBV7_9PEZI
MNRLVRALLERAFKAASSAGFKLFISFDYAGRGPWPKNTVISYLKKYASRAEYFKHSDGKPLVSTFEGPENAEDWIDIKDQVACFFIPDWSSEGAKPALGLAGGVADGLFNWAAWPWGSRDMETYVDASYFEYLDRKKPYMMPVSPWFYTNMPGFNKNWMWRGDDMWHDRWIQVVVNKPEYVQIISWNDYGESHHVGPLYSHAMSAFDVGKAPYNYANDRPHDGWHLTLRFWIDYYKSGKAAVTKEGLVTWYRTSPSGACSDGGTTGNTASQLQLEFPPQGVMQDKVFFSAVLGADAQATVTVGGKTFQPKWPSIPDGGVGVYHGGVELYGDTGAVSVHISRGGQSLARVDGTAISVASCHDGLTNWNPWVGSAVAAGSTSAAMPRSRDEQGCIKGTAVKGFTELCGFNCKYHYCPVSACLCQALGAPNTKPTALNRLRFPAKGRSESYSGLCGNACNYGYCPEEYCSLTKQPIIVPTVSERHKPCWCTDTGGLIKPPLRKPGFTGKPIGDVNDEKLCDFTCSRGWCPADVCGFRDDAGGDEEVDPDDACNEDDRTYSSDPSGRVGEYMHWYLMDPENAAITGRQYVIIVNLTPHTFKLTSTHKYQMDEWDWGDIPSGRARQNVAHYTEETGKNPVDNNREAYYDIEGTGKRFVVRVTSHIPDTYPRRVVFDLTGMDKGQREYKVPEQEVPVTLVITGSNSYGLITSLSFGPGNWMNGIKNEIKHRKLIDVVMPGTHEAGMSKLTDAILSRGVESNTQNQLLDIYDQLLVGSRWFDLRVSSVHQVPILECCGDYEFWISYLSDELGEVPIGRSGEKFEDVLDEINHFTRENPGKVIVLQFRYLVGIWNVPSLGPIYWDESAKNSFFDKLRGIQNRCPNLGTSSMEQLKMETLMNMNNGKGCVLIFPGHGAPKIFIGADGPAHGGHLQERRNELDKFHVAQWLSTPHFLTSTFQYSLQGIAILPTNPALYWRGVDAISPEVFPNVLMVDYTGMVLRKEPQWDALSAELYTLAIGLNLYTVSENCKINPRRSPLLLPTTQSLVMPSHPLVSKFNGIIFANGTTIDDPPPGFHPGRVEILRNGTEFSNGTVLATDVPNPDFNSTSV